MRIVAIEGKITPKNTACFKISYKTEDDDVIDKKPAIVVPQLKQESV